ncbi:hypothetical protein [Candidatus Ruminimicrobium bovinum]|uniref:hypothetical protein n=1 Tax=Candidatus Ruminimicrobium bovinum TaxID=3242779 RepID=UPI0039B8B30F
MDKKNKWIIFGVVIFILAVLVAVGPILVTKYMRNKWQNSPKYKTSYVLFNVNGTLKLSSQGEVYLAGDNKMFYIIEDISEEDKNNNLEHKVSVTGKMKMPEGDVTVDGNPVRLYISVEKIVNLEKTENIEQSEQVNSNNEEKVNLDSSVDVDVEQEKALKKSKIRIMVNAALNKSLLFDVTRGTLALENRKTLKGDMKEVAILNDEFGDKVMLIGKDKIKNFANQKIICLGRELPFVDDMPTVVGETIFEIYEVYDSDYNKLI